MCWVDVDKIAFGRLSAQITHLFNQHFSPILSLPLTFHPFNHAFHFLNVLEQKQSVPDEARRAKCCICKHCYDLQQSTSFLTSAHISLLLIVLSLLQSMQCFDRCRFPVHARWSLQQAKHFIDWRSEKNMIEGSKMWEEVREEAKIIDWRSDIMACSIVQRQPQLPTQTGNTATAKLCYHFYRRTVHLTAVTATYKCPTFLIVYCIVICITKQNA